MRVLLASLAVLAVLVAGCSGDDAAPAPSETGSATMTSSQATAGPSAPASADVTMMGNLFSPAEVTIKAGGSVRWVDHDSANPHNVVSSSPGNEFRSPDMDAALPTHPKEYTHTFQNVGTVDYVCEYHNGMVGKVFVVA